MEVTFLGSGSKGNATIVSAGRTRVLLEAGLPAERLRERLVGVGVVPASIDAIVVTHGHHDHTQAAAGFSRDHGCVVHAARTMFRDPEKKPERLSLYDPSRPFAVGDLRFHPFRVPHDAEPTVGFVVEGGDGARLGYATDLGHAREDVVEALRRVDLLVLEFNHDEEMLRGGPYPRPLKDRIAGNSGHLSNAQAASILERVAHRDLRGVYLAHLSTTNNRPALALTSARAAVGRAGHPGILVEALSQAEPLGPRG